MPFRYLVWTSEAKGVFSLGGDLAFFGHCVRTGDERRLTALRASLHRRPPRQLQRHGPADAHRSAGHRRRRSAAASRSMITNDIVVAEKGVKFGLPEILFNLFPGMGGYSYLVRKIGEKAGTRLRRGWPVASRPRRCWSWASSTCWRSPARASGTPRASPSRPAVRHDAHHPPRLQAGRSGAEAGAVGHRRHLGRARHADSAATTCAAWTASPGCRKRSA